MSKNILIAIILAITTAVVGFLGGVKYQSNQRPRFTRNRQTFRPLSGEIISLDSASLTLKMSDSSTRIVILSGSTSYSQSATGSRDDLKIGGQIAVFGSDNPDGSATAQNIQLNPVFRARVGDN